MSESLTVEQVIEKYDSKGLSSPTEKALMDCLNYEQKQLLELWLLERVEINKLYSENWFVIQELADRI